MVWLPPLKLDVLKLTRPLASTAVGPLSTVVPSLKVIEPSFTTLLPVFTVAMKVTD